MPAFECQSTSTKYQERSIVRLDLGIAKMRQELIPELSTPFRALTEARNKLLAQVGFKMPRNVISLLKLYGLSPGTLQLWHDDESGYFVEARVKPGAPPIYHHVTDDVAIKILKGELTKELEMTLMTPDEYIGE